MSDQITIVVSIKTKPECREEVKHRLRELSLLTSQEEGNICYVLHQATNDSNHFIIYEQWKNQKALDFHMNQDYLKKFLAESQKLLKADIHGTICNQIT